MLDRTDPCPACGFAAATVSPTDAAVALRSYPRRYRGVLVRPDDEDAPGDVVRRPGGGGRSALDHAAAAAGVVEAAVEALRLAAIREEPVVSLDAPAAPAESVDGVLDRLAAVTGAAADAVARLGREGWDRTVRAGGQRLTALDVARHAVHAGVHHLRAADQAVREALRAR